MLEHGSFLPRRGGAVDCLARGERFASLFGGHGRLPHRPRRPSRSGLPPTDLPDREGLGARRSPRVAVAQAARARGRRLHDHDAGHGSQPGRVSPDGVPKAGLRFSHRADRRRVLAGDGDGLEAALASYEGKQTGENSLFRTLHDCLAPGDVVLFDRYFSGWFDLALLSARGVDVVVRKHQLRDTDFRKGQRLGAGDQLVCWRKPPRPKWMSRETYVALPGELTLREVRVRVTQKGFRTKELVVVTTLLDAEEYPADEIAELYRRRWQAELNLRSLKTVLQMDHLRCKTPHRVRNEFFMHLVAYNLIRRVMALAARDADTCPWQLSFKGALQTLNAFLPMLCTDASLDAWCTAFAAALATHIVGNRPDRYEPRVKKRRAKEYDLMNKPRADYKRQMAK